MGGGTFYTWNSSLVFPHVISLSLFPLQAECKADVLLATKDGGHFNSQYVEVMQHLDRCYHTFVLLSAEAEEKISKSLVNLVRRKKLELTRSMSMGGMIACHNCLGDICVETYDLDLYIDDKAQSVLLTFCL